MMQAPTFKPRFGHGPTVTMPSGNYLSLRPDAIRNTKSNNGAQPVRSEQHPEVYSTTANHTKFNRSNPCFRGPSDIESKHSGPTMIPVLHLSFILTELGASFLDCRVIDLQGYEPKLLDREYELHSREDQLELREFKSGNRELEPSVRQRRLGFGEAELKQKIKFDTPVAVEEPMVQGHRDGREELLDKLKEEMEKM
jgi:hypothetical protein